MSQVIRRRRAIVAMIAGAVVSLTLGWSTALGSHSAPDPQWVSVRVHGEGGVPATGGPATISIDVRCPDPTDFEYWAAASLTVTASQSNIVFGGVFNGASGSAWMAPRCTGQWETLEVEVLPYRGAFMIGQADVEAYAQFDGCCTHDYEYIYDTDTDHETVTLRASAVPVVVSPG
jgi:hypothetical protein